MRTMQELRMDIRDKVPELHVRLEMKAHDMGLEMVKLPAADMESYYDQDQNHHCFYVLLACDGLRQWLYDDEGNPLDPYESELLDRLQVSNAEDSDRHYGDIDHALENFPSEVRDCDDLLAPILAQGITKGLKDEDLFEYTWLMMSPFLTGRDQTPTEADWQQKKAELILERTVKADEDRQDARKTLESFIRESLTKDREYTLSLLLGILAEAKDSPGES